jgi:hypothetical protein
MSLDIKALRVNRRTIDNFIRADPVMVSLIRSELKESGDGGYVKAGPNTLTEQQFRLVPFKRRLYDYTAKMASGDVPVEQYALVGRVTVDIRRDDEFDYNNDHYRVVSVEPKTDDRARSDCVVAQIEIKPGDKAPPTP